MPECGLRPPQIRRWPHSYQPSLVCPVVLTAGDLIVPVVLTAVVGGLLHHPSTLDFGLLVNSHTMMLPAHGLLPARATNASQAPSADMTPQLLHQLYHGLQHTGPPQRAWCTADAMEATCGAGSNASAFSGACSSVFACPTARRPSQSKSRSRSRKVKPAGQ